MNINLMAVSYKMPGRSTKWSLPYRHSYQGQFAEKDEETGYHQFEARLWDSRIGRWMVTDPAGQHFSPYLGMGNDPINGVDPDGRYDLPTNTWQRFWNFVSFRGYLNKTPEAVLSRYGTSGHLVHEYYGALIGDVAISGKQAELIDAIRKGQDVFVKGVWDCPATHALMWIIPGAELVSGLASLSITGLKFSPKIIGTAQITGTRGHALISKVIAKRYALDPRVSKVTLDLGYKKLTGIGRYGPRPDIGVLFKSERVKVFEVASKTDDLVYLSLKNDGFMLNNKIHGKVKVVKVARWINKVFPK